MMDRPIKNPLISIVVPVFNEEKTIKEILRRIQRVKLSKEVIVVDDGSQDRSKEIIKKEKGLIFIDLTKNCGKGFALKKGVEKAQGDIVLIQDADLEYDPKEYEKLIGPIIKGKAEVVYGSRLGDGREGMFFFQTVANRFLTFLTNLLYGSSISDMETGYKVFKRKVIQGIDWRARRFDFEPEITAKTLKKGFKIYEVPITYKSRKYQEGKKITWIDGLIALKALFWYRFFD